MDAFFCKLAAAVRLNYGSGGSFSPLLFASSPIFFSLSPSCLSIRLPFHAVHSLMEVRDAECGLCSLVLTPGAPSTGTAIHTDVRSSYRPRLLMRLYEMEACQVSRQASTEICSDPRILSSFTQRVLIMPRVLRVPALAGARSNVRAGSGLHLPALPGGARRARADAQRRALENGGAGGKGSVLLASSGLLTLRCWLRGASALGAATRAATRAASDRQGASARAHTYTHGKPGQGRQRRAAAAG
jgi:hypothetical protein